MLNQQVNRGVRSRDIIVPAPILGLNKKDALSAMDAGYAITMDNYMPLDNKIVLRSGYTKYVTLGQKVQTLVEYKKPSQGRFLAVSGGKVYNISSPTNVTAYSVTFEENNCQTVQYKDRLFFVNGIDTPKVFYVDAEGVEHFEDWGFTAEALNATRIIAGSVSHEFLWFVEKNTLKAWYASEAGNVAGKLNSFDLAQVAKHGGQLVAVMNWTVDGGTGIDDYTVFLTSEGEALLYSGSNPNSADSWSLKGSYKLSKPIGYKCWLQYQGDIVIISEDGYIPLSKSLTIGNSGQSTVAFSDNIRGLVIERTSQNKDKSGWQGVIYTKKGYGLFNVPTGQQFEQHVINVNTGAWCRFVNIRAFCWGLFGENLFFGSDKDVFMFDNGQSDNGVAIEGVVEQAYTNLGSNNLKKIQLLNPRTRCATAYNLNIYTNMDFESQVRKYYTRVGSSGMTKWNQAKWSSSKNPNDTKWSTTSATKILSQWIANSSTGYQCSIVFKTKTRGNIIEWYNTGVRYEVGSGIM